MLYVENVIKMMGFLYDISHYMKVAIPYILNHPLDTLYVLFVPLFHMFLLPAIYLNFIAEMIFILLTRDRLGIVYHSRDMTTNIYYVLFLESVLIIYTIHTIIQKKTMH